MNQHLAPIMDRRPLTAGRHNSRQRLPKPQTVSETPQNEQTPMRRDLIAAPRHPHITSAATVHLGDAPSSGSDTCLDTRIIPHRRGFSADAHPHAARTRERSGLAEWVEQERVRKGGPGQLGDPLDDNVAIEDGYRYHDIIHLAHATVLGWSPVLRALIGAKRKDVGDCDRVQDGARAIAIEEGLAAFVFSYFEQFDFKPDAFSWELFKHVQRTVRVLEVASQPLIAWRSAYTQAFEIFPRLCKAKGGVVECDLDTRELRLIE